MAFEAGTIRGHLDLDTTSFEHGMEESHTHAEEGSARIREALEAVSEVFSEALGPEAEKFGQTLQSLFAGFSEGPLIGSLNVIGETLGAVREVTEGVGAQFHEMAIAAERAGVSVEFMSRLSAVGSTVGVGAEQLGMGFKILEQRAGEAADGTKEAVEGFQRVGLSVSEAVALSSRPEELFNRIQAAIGKMSDQGQRAAASSELLGRAGMSLIPVFAMGGKQFDDLADQLQRLGGTMTDSDAEMGESLGRLEGYFRAAMLGIERAVAKPVLSFLEAHMASFEPRLEAAAGAIAGGIGKAWDFIQGKTTALTPILRELEAAVGPGLSKAFHEVTDSVGPALSYIFEQDAKLAKDAWPSIKEMAGVIGGDLAGAAVTVVPLLKSLGEMILSIDELIGGAMVTAFKALEPVFASLGRGLKELMDDAIETLKTITSVVQAATDAAGITDPSKRNGNPYNLKEGVSTADYMAAKQAGQDTSWMHPKPAAKPADPSPAGPALTTPTVTPAQPPTSLPAVTVSVSPSAATAVPAPVASVAPTASVASSAPVAPVARSAAAAVPAPVAAVAPAAAVASIAPVAPVARSAATAVPELVPQTSAPALKPPIRTDDESGNVPYEAMGFLPPLQLPSLTQARPAALASAPAVQASQAARTAVLPSETPSTVPIDFKAMADSIAAGLHPLAESTGRRREIGESPAAGRSRDDRETPSRQSSRSAEQRVPESISGALAAASQAMAEAMTVSAASLRGAFLSSVTKFSESANAAGGVMDDFRQVLQASIQSFRSFAVPTSVAATAGVGSAPASGVPSSITNNYSVKVDAKVDDSANKLGRTIAAGLQQVKRQSQDAHAAVVTRAMAQQSMGGT